MEHTLDIEADLFEKIKEHEITIIKIPKFIHDREVKIHDSLKLYPTGGETEALRIEITALSELSREKQQGRDESLLSTLSFSEGENRTVHDTVSTINELDPNKSIFVKIHFELLEWMCWIETELDEQLREEQEWLQGLR